MAELDSNKIEQIVRQAKSDFQSGSYKNAISGFSTARQFFLDQGDSLNAAEMANNLSVAYLQNKQTQEALKIVLGTDLVFEEAGETLKQAIALGNIGAALEAQKDLEGAGEAYQKSADLFDEAGEKDMRSTVLKSLSAIHIRQGKQLESIFAMQKSLEGQKKLTFRERFLKRFLKLPFKFLK